MLLYKSFLKEEKGVVRSKGDGLAKVSFNGIFKVYLSTSRKKSTLTYIREREKKKKNVLSIARYVYIDRETKGVNGLKKTE